MFIKPSFCLQEEEPGSHPLSLSMSDYLTPSWSLSPSSSPLSHSEASDSDREEDEEEEDDDDDDDDEDELEELRGRMMRRRKKRKTSVTVKKKAAPRTQPRPLSFTRPAPSSSSPFQQSLTTPTTNINNNININIGHGASGTLSRRQHCPYCGRHFRSLARHLEKHHDQQPEVRAAMEQSHLQTPSAATTSRSFSSPAQPSSSSGPSLFSREHDSLSSTSKPGAVSFSLSLSPPPPSSTSRKTSTTASKKATSPAASAVNKSPPVTPNPPARRGRPPKREKTEHQKKHEEVKKHTQEEEAPPTPGREESKDEMHTRVDGHEDEKSVDIKRYVSVQSFVTLLCALQHIEILETCH